MHANSADCIPRGSQLQCGTRKFYTGSRQLEICVLDTAGKKVPRVGAIASAMFLHTATDEDFFLCHGIQTSSMEWVLCVHIFPSEGSPVHFRPEAGGAPGGDRRGGRPGGVRRGDGLVRVPAARGPPALPRRPGPPPAPAAAPAPSPLCGVTRWPCHPPLPLCTVWRRSRLLPPGGGGTVQEFGHM